jgi:hypothetical protein
MTISWYRPYSGFWPRADQLLNAFADGYQPTGDAENVMTYGTPRPQQVIRQVPANS